jgi:hypothetical protein
MTDFTITITGIRTTTVGEFTNVIKRVEWTLKGTLEGQSFELPQKTEMGPVDPENFIALEDMTDPAVVVAWVEAAETGMDSMKAHIQYVLDRMVAEAATESVAMPWVAAEEPEAP